MMKKLFILLTALITLSAPITAENKEKISEKIHSIEVSVPGRLLVYLGDESGFRLKSDTTNDYYINCYVKNGILIIKPVPGMENYLIGKNLVIYVSTEVDSVKINSSRNYTINRRTKDGNHVKK